MEGKRFPAAWSGAGSREPPLRLRNGVRSGCLRWKSFFFPPLCRFRLRWGLHCAFDRTVVGDSVPGCRQNTENFQWGFANGFSPGSWEFLMGFCFSLTPSTSSGSLSPTSVQLRGSSDGVLLLSSTQLWEASNGVLLQPNSGENLRWNRSWGLRSRIQPNSGETPMEFCFSPTPVTSDRVLSPTSAKFQRSSDGVSLLLNTRKSPVGFCRRLQPGTEERPIAFRCRLQPQLRRNGS